MTGLLTRLAGLVSAGMSRVLTADEERARRLLDGREQVEIVDALAAQTQGQRGKTFLLDHPPRVQSSPFAPSARCTRSSTV